MPLYSRLSAAEQHRVFAPHTGRRVVLATNVAETSLTVPGIRYVVDTGVARISRYSVRTKVQRLPVEAISQASANQRSGRCGRLGPGIAIRLYSEEDFEGRPEFTDPEILRTNLASVILQMASLGLGDMARFPFVEPPDRRNVTAGRPAAGGAGRASRRQAHEGRPAAGPAAHRPAAGADGARGRAARLRPRGDRDRRRAVAAGPAGATRRAEGAGRPAARALQGRGQRLPHLAQPVALRQGAAARALLVGVPADVQAGVPQLAPGPRVAGLRVAAAPGLQGDGDQGRAARRRSPTPTASTRPCWPGCCRTSGCSRSATARTLLDPGEDRASTSAPAGRGSRSSRAAGCTGRTRSS